MSLARLFVSRHGPDHRTPHGVAGADPSMRQFTVNRKSVDAVAGAVMAWVRWYQARVSLSDLVTNDVTKM